jgi:hypothetical protein
MYNQVGYMRTSIYEFQETKKFIFKNISQNNKLRLALHSTNTEPRAYKNIGDYEECRLL